MLTDKKIKELNSYKTPKTKSKYVGIELEFSSPVLEKIQLMKIIDDYKLTKYTQVSEDGTESYYNENSWELSILLKQTELKSILPIIGKFLEHIKANINKSHGTHVHLDMRNRDAAVCYNNLVKAQPLLFKVADPYRTNNRYCFPQYSSNIYSAKRNHYAAVSPILDKQKDTIEVRIREGLIDWKKIYYWIKLLISIVDNKYIYNKINKVSDLEKIVKTNIQIRNHVKQCIQEHNDGKTKLKENKYHVS